MVVVKLSFECAKIYAAVTGPDGQYNTGPYHDGIERMSYIYLLTATEAEARAAARRAFRAPKPGLSREITCGVNRVQVFVTGVGPRAAESAMRSLADEMRVAKPCVIIVAGTCGGLGEGVQEGTIVTYTECLFERSASVESATTDAELTARMGLVLREAGIESRSVKGVTSPVVAATRGEKIRLAASGASVVDMESYVILSVARQIGVPTLVLRVVSDGADLEVPDFTRAITPAGRVNRLAAAAIASRSPFATARLMLAERRALRKLSLALGTVLGSGCWLDAG